MKRILLLILMFTLVGCSHEPLAVDVSVKRPSDPQVIDGSIKLNVQGGKQPYEIYVDGELNHLQQLEAGMHVLKVVDQGRNTYEEKIDMTCPLNVETTLVHNHKAFASEGAIKWHIEGGLLPYKVMVNNMEVSTELVHLAAGQYDVRIEDAAAQCIMYTVEILEPQVSSIEDSEGHNYPVVKIGNQWWMAANLKAKRDASGQELNYHKYNEDNTLSAKYGYLYDYETASQPIIEGWRLPTHEDFLILESYLGMPEEDLKKMASSDRGYAIGTQLQIGGETGFNAQLSGWYASSVGYDGMGLGVAYWTSDLYDQDRAIVRTLMKGDGRIFCYPDPIDWQMFVRLVKEN